MQVIPVRELGYRTRGVAGRIYSYKNRRQVFYESQLELSFIYHLEFSPTVKSYTEQPFKVYHNTGKKKTVYVPDFAVYHNDIYTKPLLVEIKYSQEIKDRQEYIRTKINVLKTFAKDNGFEFRLITERELSDTRTQNYRFLYGYRTLPENINEYIHYIDKILGYLRQKLFATPQDIIDHISDDFFEKAMALTFVWHLVANGIIKTDLNQPLTNSSILTLYGKEIEPDKDRPEEKQNPIIFFFGVR